MSFDIGERFISELHSVPHTFGFSPPPILCGGFLFAHGFMGAVHPQEHNGSEAQRKD